MPTSPELKDARKRIERELELTLDDERIKKIIDAALDSKRRVWADFNCKSCNKGQRHLVEIPDTVAVTKVLEVLLNQTKGRPQEQQPDAGLTVNYRVELAPE